MTIEEIKKINELIDSRSNLKAKKGLDLVEDRLEKLEKFYKEVKKIIREQGRTNFVSIQDIENLIVSIFN